MGVACVAASDNTTMTHDSIQTIDHQEIPVDTNITVENAINNDAANTADNDVAKVIDDAVTVGNDTVKVVENTVTVDSDVVKVVENAEMHNKQTAPANHI